jgi:hypothetical protein
VYPFPFLKEASGMTATQTNTKTPLPWLVGDRVLIEHKGQRRPGRISSIHHVNDGVEYVVRTDPRDGGMGEVLNIWTSSGSSSFLTALGGAR